MRQEVVCKRQGSVRYLEKSLSRGQFPVTPDGATHMRVASLARSGSDFQGRVSPVRLAVVARRQRHLSPELSPEVACVAEAPAVRNRGYREAGVHEIVSGSGQAVLSDDGANRVPGRLEGAVHGSGCDVVCGGEIPDPDCTVREMLHDPRL